MVWYCHLLKNFPLFVVIHAVIGFGIVNKAEVDVFLELSQFFDDPTDVGNLISYSWYMHSTSWDMLGWMKHKLESSLLGEISITSDVQMILLYWRK